MKKAIVFTVFDRPEFLEPTLESWLNVEYLDQYDIFFKVEPSEKNNEVLNIIKNFSYKSGKDVKIMLNSTRRGVLLNPWEAIDLLVNKFSYDFFILAEDDLIVSNDILNYFNQAIHKYSSQENVLCICSMNDTDLNDEYVFQEVDSFRVLVWGTWASKWNNYLRDTWDKDYSSGIDGGPSGWDWNISLRVIPQNNLICIAPSTSRVQHIGSHGTHVLPENYESTRLKTFKDKYIINDFK